MWRTREDTFAADWAELRARLADAPELEATTLFEDLLRRKPDGYTPGQRGRCSGGSSSGGHRRGLPKVKAVLLWFALAHNLMRSVALRAAAAAPA